MARIVGIDLGTTNSLVAYMDEGTPRVIPERNERTMVPSVVAMTDNGLIVGDSAKEHLTRNPERTVYSVKRFMGKSLADVKASCAYFPYTLHGTGRGHPHQARGEDLFAPADLGHDPEGTEATGRGASRQRALPRLSSLSRPISTIASGKRRRMRA